MGDISNRHGNEYRMFRDGCGFYNNTSNFTNLVIIDTRGRIFTEVKNKHECDLYISRFPGPKNEDPRKYVHVQSPVFGNGKTFFENIHVRNEPIQF